MFTGLRLIKFILLMSGQGEHFNMFSFYIGYPKLFTH